jgi:hypothetical protein
MERVGGTARRCASRTSGLSGWQVRASGANDPAQVILAATARSYDGIQAVAVPPATACAEAVVAPCMARMKGRQSLTV